MTTRPRARVRKRERSCIVHGEETVSHAQAHTQNSQADNERVHYNREQIRSSFVDVPCISYTRDFERDAADTFYSQTLRQEPRERQLADTIVFQAIQHRRRRDLHFRGYLPREADSGESMRRRSASLGVAPDSIDLIVAHKKKTPMIRSAYPPLLYSRTTLLRDVPLRPPSSIRRRLIDTPDAS